MANYVVSKDETANQEVLTYGFSLILMAIATYSTVILSALLLGVFREILIAIGTFILMRTAIGGVHAKHRAVCLITYSTVLYLSIYLSGILRLDLYATAALYLFNIIILILYAPGDTVEQPMVKNRMLRKISGLFLVTILFALSIFVRDMRIETNIILFVSTLTSILLHPFTYRIYGCERS